MDGLEMKAQLGHTPGTLQGEAKHLVIMRHFGMLQKSIGRLQVLVDEIDDKKAVVIIVEEDTTKLPNPALAAMLDRTLEALIQATNHVDEAIMRLREILF